MYFSIMKNLKNLALFLLIFILPALCSGRDFPRPQGYVNDFANIIDSQSEVKLSVLLRELETKTKTQFAVVTVPDLDGSDIDSYASELYENWGIGNRDNDKGVLLLVSLGDRKTRIETGYGAEGIIPDGLAGEILDSKVIPFFKKGDYSGGILMGALAISNIIAKDANVTLGSQQEYYPQTQRRKPSLAQKIFGFIFFIFMIYLFIKNPFLFLLFMGFGGGGRSGGGFGGGGFGGFGGGMSGGGGASRGW
jgi:uncharacterized protein